MEAYAATQALPLEASRSELENSDAMVLILGWRYGYVPAEGNPDRLSITQIEYRTAREQGIPVFAYITAEGSPASAAGRKKTSEQDQERMARFRDLVQKTQMVRTFGDTAALAQQNHGAMLKRGESVRCPAPDRNQSDRDTTTQCRWTRRRNHGPGLDLCR